MIKQLFYIVLILFFGFIGIISLLPNGLIIGHDVQNHVTRIIKYHDAIEDGQIPPRWAGKFYGGIGSPIFLVSYHLPYILAEGIFRITNDAITSFKYVLIVSYILSGVFAYIAFRAIGSSFSAFIGSVCYLWAP